MVHIWKKLLNNIFSEGKLKARRQFPACRKLPFSSKWGLPRLLSDDFHYIFDGAVEWSVVLQFDEKGSFLHAGNCLFALSLPSVYPLRICCLATFFIYGPL
jgi:hypothetical protein